MSTDSTIKRRTATNNDATRVRELVFGVLREYGLEPDENGLDRDMLDLEKNYIERGGLFDVLIDRQGRIVGTVGLYPLDSAVVELRKMYFSKSIRGKGLGKELLDEMIYQARRLGFSKIVLETASPLVEAIGLYRSRGFRIAAVPHAERCDQSFELDL